MATCIERLVRGSIAKSLAAITAFQALLETNKDDKQDDKRDHRHGSGKETGDGKREKKERKEQKDGNKDAKLGCFLVRAMKDVGKVYAFGTHFVFRYVLLLFVIYYYLLFIIICYLLVLLCMYLYRRMPLCANKRFIYIYVICLFLK
jgi:hypothetical protein